MTAVALTEDAEVVVCFGQDIAVFAAEPALEGTVAPDGANTPPAVRAPAPDVL
ncbi:hypothetical protein OG292_05705 [Streptomyces sp. NBC_01511]|uniref:hypothetical protein n=1 Tax=unclassified Streptomyces TaxID=2593676 RepID=UPI003867B3A7